MELKHKLLFGLFILSVTLMLSACSENEFSAAPGSVFEQCVDARPEVKCIQTCDESGLCFKEYDYTIKVDAQQKDILFVVDNSGSMYREQQRMGSMFPNFFNLLEDVDYRLAITTTDIENSENLPDLVNGFGDFQNGKLVKFPDGQPNGALFLDGSLPTLTEQNQFEETITWEQTDTCERNNYVQAHCPSGDERGILAASMVIDNNEGNFIRPVGHMAVVILSDEDEGSAGNRFVDDQRERPQSFIDNFRAKYPNKTVAVHSIIIQPGDSACFNRQDEPGHPPGEYGAVYSELTELTRGIQGDICATDSNYSSQLQAIGESVSFPRDPMPCRPYNDEVSVNLVDDPNYKLSVDKNFSQNELVITEALPKDTEIRIRYKCIDK